MSNKKRNFLIVLLSIILIILVLIEIKLFSDDSIFNKLFEEDINVVFTFQDEDKLERTIDVFSETFSPDKITVTINDIDNSELIMVDDSNLDLKKVGTYNVIYYIIYKDKRYEQIQVVNVVDKVAPVITLEGKNVTMLVGETYKEPGYKANDNYDGDIKELVEIINNVDTKKAGNYKITYKVNDSSGNKAEISREVTVKKPNVIVSTPPKEVKIETPKVVEVSYPNTIKKNKFTKTSINLEGYLKNVQEENKIKLVGDETYEFDITVDNNNYSLSINPDNINNGNYKMYINEELLLNKITPVERLSRAKVGSKLVTFKYNGNDEVSIEVANHNYQYDILINPGHGSDDTGAVNEYIMEKEMNLTVSMYEKCRYEAHGLSVYMTRTNDNYGGNFGPDGLIRLHKLAYEMGYYGAVSKIVYSNHHNSIGNNYYSGYEILVAGALTKDDLANEYAIANKWNDIFDLKENHKRFYARDYVTEAIYSKLNGEIYSFKDNYAVNRIPLGTANVKSIIFEGAYMSNKEEFKWYWLDNNWYKVSEAKIEVYVNSLGLTYNSDNSSCL